MYAISHARAVRLQRSARGFSLIELGIVIAVIAVLAAVVIFGRGFIVASRVSKLVEATNTVRKAASTYAGLMGGSLNQVEVPSSGIVKLANRQLLPPLVPNQNVWVVSGPNPPTSDSYKIEGVGLGQVATVGGGMQNAVSIQFYTPKKENAEDVVSSVMNDPNMIKGSQEPGGSGGLCASSPTDAQAAKTYVCFSL